MTRITSDCEGGTNTATITAAAMGPGFNTPTIGSGSAMTFSNTQAAHGSLAMKLVMASAIAAYQESTINSSAPSDTYYVWFDGSMPAIGWRLIEYRVSTGSACSVNVTGSNKFQLQNSAGTNIGQSSGTLSANTWYRLEVAPVANSTTGSMTLNVFLLDGNTSQTSLNIDSSVSFPSGTSTGTGPYVLRRFGKTNTTGANTNTIYMDSFWYDDATIGGTGPYPPKQYPVATLNGTAVLTSATGVQNAISSALFTAPASLSATSTSSLTGTSILSAAATMASTGIVQRTFEPMTLNAPAAMTSATASNNAVSSATFSAPATLSSFAVYVQTSSATLTASAVLGTATAVNTISSASTMTAPAVMSAAVVDTETVAATLNAPAVLSSSVSKTSTVAATFSAPVIFAVSVVQNIISASTMTAPAQLIASPQGSYPVTALMVAPAVLSAALTATVIIGSATLSAPAVFASSGVINRSFSPMTLSAPVVLTAQPLASVTQATATFTAPAILSSAVAVHEYPAAVSMTAPMSMTSNGVVVRSFSPLSLNAPAALSSIATQGYVGTAVLAAPARLAASSTIYYGGAATLTAACRLQVGIGTLPRQFNVGIATSTLRGQTTAQNMSYFEQWIGPTSIHRVYNGSTYVNFTTSGGNIDYDANGNSIRTTHMSWNPLALSLVSENPPVQANLFSGFDPTQLKLYLATNGAQGNLASYGTETQANIAWLMSAPKFHRIWWNPWHEADNSQNQIAFGGDGGTPQNPNPTAGTPNQGAFRAAYRILADIIHAFNNPNWKTVWLLQAFAWKGSAGSSRDPVDFWPGWPSNMASGKNYVDIAACDVYNEGALKGEHWDSPGISIGIPYEAAENANYQARYGSGGSGSPVNGYKTTDSSGLTWQNGFPGWCEVVGINWLVGEIGTPRNIQNFNPAWCAVVNRSNTKTDWIKEFGAMAARWNGDSTHNQDCVALEYFEPSGRTYYDAPDNPDPTTNYLATACRYTSGTGAGNIIVNIKAEVSSSSALPATGVAIGDRYLRSDLGQCWICTAVNVSTGAPTWHNEANYTVESWQTWWDESANAAGVIPWDGANTSESGLAGMNALYGYPIMLQTIPSMCTLSGAATLGATGVINARIRLSGPTITVSTTFPTVRLSGPTITVVPAATSASSTMQAPAKLLATATQIIAIAPVVRLGAPIIQVNNTVQYWNSTTNAWQATSVPLSATATLKAPAVLNVATPSRVSFGLVSMTAPAAITQSLGFIIQSATCVLQAPAQMSGSAFQNYITGNGAVLSAPGSMTANAIYLAGKSVQAFLGAPAAITVNAITRQVTNATFSAPANITMQKPITTTQISAALSAVPNLIAGVPTTSTPIASIMSAPCSLSAAGVTLPQGFARLSAPAQLLAFVYPLLFGQAAMFAPANLIAGGVAGAVQIQFAAASFLAPANLLASSPKSSGAVSATLSAPAHLTGTAKQNWAAGAALSAPAALMALSVILNQNFYVWDGDNFQPVDILGIWDGTKISGVEVLTVT